MTAPFVGLPTVGAGCGFGAELDSPTCARGATVHLIVRSAAWGVVGLASCDGHAPVARASGVVLDEHPHTGTCESPGCTWSDA